MSASRSRVRSLLDSGTGIAVAMAVMNATSYAYTMIAARFLGPRQYGAFWAIMSLLLVVSVVSLGLQATAARRVSADPEHVGQIERTILRVSMRSSLAVGAVLLALAPVINHVLRLDDLLLAAMAGPASVPLTLMGAHVGILQGERRWLPLGLIFVFTGVPRLAIGTALLWWWTTPTVAFFGVLIASVIPVIIGERILRHKREDDVPPSAVHNGRSVAGETLQSSQVLFAFFALSNLDIVVARNVLDPHEAGLYAGGLLLTKVLVFLPQFVVVVAFPAMASARERGRALTLSLGLIAVIGLAATVVTAVAPQLVLVFVGGQEYADLTDTLWLFGLLGTALAMVQLVVYAVIARRGQRSVFLVWGALVAMFAGGFLTSSPVMLLGWVLAVDTALLLALVLISYYLIWRTDTEALEPVAS